MDGYPCFGPGQRDKARIEQSAPEAVVKLLVGVGAGRRYAESLVEEGIFGKSDFAKAHPIRDTMPFSARLDEAAMGPCRGKVCFDDGVGLGEQGLLQRSGDRTRSEFVGEEGKVSHASLLAVVDE
ncbi:MAG: hypothetical protein BWY17_00889 [Deltaproteobacteria bacterium ADurb.Bin207]|jgi:hypothetical protein|nr:MAG: hypothetical protein BWY17_00889 [Deltaproteobacteria bacterium ADurb.Bin207]HPY17755.1 hypothetical protein [Polyangiaceae bacterium]